MVLNRQAFTELLGPLREVLDRNLTTRVIQSVPMLKSLPKKECEKVLALFSSVSYTPGQAMLTIGQTYSTFFIVKSGTVRITKGSDSGSLNFSSDCVCVDTLPLLGIGCCLLLFVAEEMVSGGYFGEQALAGDVLCDCSVVAVDAVECFVLDRRRVESELGSLAVSNCCCSHSF